MEDREIIEKFNSRDDEAIRSCEAKYGAYLRKIAMNILLDREDTEECLNDSYLQAWNSIPPASPRNLLGFLTAVTRANAIDLYRRNHAEKRRSLFEAQPISELSEIVSDSYPEEIVDGKMLSDEISRFLQGETKDARTVFVLRYYFMDSISDIRDATGFSAAKIKSLLFRTRNKLKDVLKKEGYNL
ncbi:MAG: RNA polymerase sigma factor [Lachnospiraceae bacterium]|nr:RNA polymerase sigma factor [Lachnospiraceae bacterium]